MVASQMEAAIYDQVSITFNAEGKNAAFRASGSVLRFDGFLKLYRQAMDDDQSDEAENQALPPLKSGEMLAINQITPAQHFTEAPPRFTEASLVKRLEELGIGRPSTYAAIISVLQERGYVRLDKKRFIAEMRGRLVSSFLEAYFTKYVEYDFTAQLENQLDEVSDGKQEWTEVLRNFWQPFIALINETKELTPREILEKIDGLLAQFIYNKLDVTDADKACPSCKVGKLHLKTGKFGAFLGCDQYPTCNYKKALDVSGDADDPSHGDVEFPRTLGMHPSLSVEIQMKKGPYGVYVEMEEDGKAKRASLPKGRDAASFTLEEAVKLLALPRLVGNHPEDGKPIKAGLGRFGAYLQYDGKYISLKGDDDVLTIGMNRAVDLIAIAATTAAPLRILGKHPNDDVELAIYDGKYGAYIKYHKINASLPKGADIASFTLEDAVKLIASKDDGKAKTTSASSKKTSSKSVVAEKTVKLKKTTTSNKSKATASKKTM
jgi:DNA topoisomerase-1